MIPPPGLHARYALPGDGDDVVFFDEPVAWVEAADAGAGRGPFQGWVLLDGALAPAEEEPGFDGYEFRPPVVGVLPGAGWQVELETDGAKGDRGPFPVLAWLFRGDGRVLAAAVAEQVVTVVEPNDTAVRFVPPTGAQS